MKTYLIKTTDDLEWVAQELYDLKDQCAIYTFSGPLGAGKTTLSQQLLKKFGVNEPVTSPTYAYLNIYQNNLGQHFYHFDLYRLKSAEDFLDAGFEDYLYKKNSWVLIEWPEIIEPLLKDRVCRMHLDYEQDGRKIEIVY